MNQDKIYAKVVGILFITTMIAGMIDSYAAMPLLTTSLAAISANRTVIMAGVFLLLYMSLGVVGIALFLYPVLKRHNKLIAASYLGFRIIECVFLVFGALVSLFLIAMSKEPVFAGSPESSRLITSLAMNTRINAFQIAMLILGLNSIVMCGLLFRTRLIPRWISAIGVLGYFGLLVSSLLAVCVPEETKGIATILYIPGALFELILFPAWLIIKGFNSQKDSDGDSKKPNH
jgi:hypothetical protein